jgi:hypothetical protein
MGAALMRRNQLVARGRNFYKKSHPQSKTIYNGIHAEFHCLNGIDPGKCRGCVLFVARVTNRGTLSMARPCGECLDLLRERGIRAFYYTDYDGEIVREIA